MRLSGLLVLLILAWPILEIATFIAVGGQIGLLPTLALVLAAGAIGVLVVRMQGLRLLTSMRADIEAGRLPAGKMVRGAMIALAGLLFLLPGFLTDIIALALLLPPVQMLIGKVLASRVTVVETRSTGFARQPRAGVVDLDEEEWRRGDESGGRGNSPWSAPPRSLGPD